MAAYLQRPATNRRHREGKIAAGIAKGRNAGAKPFCRGGIELGERVGEAGHGIDRQRQKGGKIPEGSFFFFLVAPEEKGTGGRAEKVAQLFSRALRLVYACLQALSPSPGRRDKEKKGKPKAQAKDCKRLQPWIDRGQPIKRKPIKRQPIEGKPIKRQPIEGKLIGKLLQGVFKPHQRHRREGGTGPRA